MKRKLIICLLSVFCLLFTLLGVSACSNEQFEIYVDGYTLQIEEDGSYSILDVPKEVLQQTEWECPAEIGGYPISFLAATLRMHGMWAPDRYMTDLGNVRKLILPASFKGVGDVLYGVRVIVTPNLLSEMRIPYYSNYLWYFAPKEDIGVQYLTEENFVDNMVIIENKEKTEATLLFAFGGEELVVPKTYHDLPITSIGEGALNGENYKSVTLNEHVTELQRYALVGSDFTQITLPSSLKTIGEYAFSNCNLTSINIPESVEHLGNYAFAGTKITEVTLPSNILYRGKFAFKECKELHSFDLSNTNWSSIPVGMFQGCDLTGDLIYPEHVNTLGDNCFANANFETFTIPKSISVIDDCVFQGCENLKELIVPDHVQSFDFSAIDGCKNLKKLHLGAMVTSFKNTYIRYPEMEGLAEITVSEENPSLHVKDGMLYERDLFKSKDTLLLCPRALPIEKLTVSCFRIGDRAFYNNSILKEIVIEGECYEIGKYAFLDCVNLEKVTLPATTKQLSFGAFHSCEKLTTINTQNVEVFNDYAFADCVSLKTLPFDSVLTIGEQAFRKCSFTHVKLNDGCKTVARLAFYENVNLEKFEYNKNFTTVDEDALCKTNLDFVKERRPNYKVIGYGCNGSLFNR